MWSYDTPGRPGEAELTDDAIVAFYTVAASGPHYAAMIARCPHSSAELIGDVVGEAVRRYSIERTFGVVGMAFANPNMPAELVHAELDQTLAAPDGPTHLGYLVQHPAALERIEEIAWRITDRFGEARCELLLRNRHLGSEFLDEHWRLDPRSAAVHRNLADSTLDDLIAEHPELHPWAACQSGVSTQMLERCLRGAVPDADHMRRIALRNPRLTNADLRHEFRAERVHVAARAGQQTPALDVLSERLGEWYPANPFDELVVGLGSHVRAIRADLAVHLATLDPAHLDAARALAAGRFAGTVAELLDVAATLTA